jgi:LasA protease
VRPLFAIFLVLFATTSSCGTSPSIWGTAQTPTPIFPLIPSSQSVIPDSPPTPVRTSSTTPTAELTLEAPAYATPTTASEGPRLEPTYTPTFDSTPILYYSQSGDSLAALAKRFNVDESEIRSEVLLPAIGFIDPGILLVIPDRISEPTSPNIQIMPDNEIIFSATSVDFDTEAYIKEADGHLSNFKEYLGSAGWVDGTEAITRLAYENSINPRILLGVLDYESRWVRGEPVDLLHTDYPMGYEDFRYKGMFVQMVWAVNQISNAYYGWRDGSLTHLSFPDGSQLRLDPRLNAGTVAIQYLFSRLHSQSQWSQILKPESGFPAIYSQMFGDPWSRADLVNPIFPPGLTQPLMVLPYEPNVDWSYTGGPHGAWEHEGALAALDFAPGTDHGGCDTTTTWVVASAPGLVVRASEGVVVVDLDGDGYEQTGWNLLYLHIAIQDRVKLGTWVEVDDHIGHASCEGGVSTGTHLHFARKYNGEWIPADGPIPFILSGWRAIAGEKPYEGKMIRGDKEILADPVGQKWSNIPRDANE